MWQTAPGRRLPDELNGGLNDGQKKTLEYICQHEGCNTKQISIGLDVPFDTIEKQIRNY